MEFPEEVYDTVKEAVEANHLDLPAALAQAEEAIRNLDCYGELIDTLVHNAIQDLVYRERHVHNVRVKTAAKAYGTEAKVKTAASATVQRVHDSLFSYYIAGKTLGQLRGEELDTVAASEEARGNGHHFNARVCRRLRGMVRDEQSVKEAVSEKRLRAIWKEVGAEAA